MTDTTTDDGVQISGTVAAGFEGVRDAFARNFSDHDELGAGVSVFLDGECVVDLTGGVADSGTGRPYDADTLQLVFSTTKGATAICAHLLAQRGELDLTAPVSRYWPEFATVGKESTTVDMFLSHRAGVPVIDQELSLADALAGTPVVEALAQQAPLWEPGTAHGYHALTYGWLVGELVRRITGRSLGQFFADEVAGPLGLDFWIGLPDDVQDRASTMVATRPKPGDFDPSQLDPEVLPLLKDMAAAFLDPNSTMNRALTLGTAFTEGDGLAWNRPEVRAAEVPAANGVTNARSLAKLYAACVGEVDGTRLLDADTVDRATEEQSKGPDRTLVVPTRFGLGFFLPSGYSPLMGPTSFGHAGFGGSLGFADRERRLGFGYVMNKLNAGLSNDPRSAGLIAAVRDAVDGTT